MGLLAAESISKQLGKIACWSEWLRLVRVRHGATVPVIHGFLLPVVSGDGSESSLAVLLVIRYCWLFGVVVGSVRRTCLRTNGPIEKW